MRAAADDRPLTYREAMRRAAGNLPTRCPQCGSARIQPLFWVDVDVYDCSEPDCHAIWSARP